MTFLLPDLGKCRDMSRHLVITAICFSARTRAGDKKVKTIFLMTILEPVAPYAQSEIRLVIIAYFERIEAAFFLCETAFFLCETAFFLRVTAARGKCHDMSKTLS